MMPSPNVGSARAYDNGQVELTPHHVRICASRSRPRTASRRRSDALQTTVGRALLSEILPPGLPFEFINKALKKKEISADQRRSAAAVCATKR
jgi:DNA-directed RNA polymerase subunit beta'